MRFHRWPLLATAIAAVLLALLLLAPKGLGGTALQWLLGAEYADAAQPATSASSAVASAVLAPTPADPRIERGRYLARAANCIGCHTGPGQAPFAGGLPIDTPLGRIYSTNITPDPDAGIGSYSLEDFDRAVRRGVARHGKRLYPAMPYPSYARMDDRDVEALFVYLRGAVAPVRYSAPEARMRWPFGMRWLMWGWNALFLDQRPMRVDPAQSAQWNRGAYLVQAVGHCGACHTPRGLLLGEKGLDERSEHFLAGAEVLGWSATSLRGDRLTGLGSWSRAEIAEYLRTGRNAHGTSFGPMSEVVSMSTQHLHDSDLDAIAVYLKSLSAVRGETRPFLYDDTAARELRAGRFESGGARLYAQYCMPCHGADGKGFARVFPPLAGNAAVVDPNAASLINLLLHGAITARVDTAATDYRMPGYGWTLNDQEIADVLTFVRGGWGNRAEAVDSAVVARRRAATAPPQEPRP
ncbi:cytochrome c [Cupriavidus sp. AU9028]|uniref:c-type cytochrome n=1 Tax=Cupriavidus sp. AU9028 TaxID=2871157 RepID=UPI001C9488EA|nr:cytochrome c [Cupriavidus sp. AU9028]MBY4897455.1 cytochrome c [Cupriavidus sp. AU9028]